MPPMLVYDEGSSRETILSDENGEIWKHLAKQTLYTQKKDSLGEMKNSWNQFPRLIAVLSALSHLVNQTRITRLSLITFVSLI